MTQFKVGDYLFHRLHQLGIKSVFGVPGDYELALLDLISENNLEWKGNPNELIASYAADGYARINGTPAAFVTTMGPGELSAYCGMAGHYCEYVPVVHIVGYPTTGAINAKTIMHHSLGDGRFDMYEKMAEHITAATTVLKDASTAAQEIDQVLAVMLEQSRPVYIGIPTDIAYAPVSNEGLKTPLPTTLPPNDKATEGNVVAMIRSLLENASKPAIVVDGGAARNNSVEEANALVAVTDLPAFVTAMGKGALNETLPSYGGYYAGAASYPEIRQYVESSDALLFIGRYPSDFNTGEFTMEVNEKAVVDFQRFYATIGERKFDVKMKHLLQALVKSFKENPLKLTAVRVKLDPYPLKVPATGPLSQDFLWEALGSLFQSGDLIIGETGTSAFGLAGSKLPKDTFMFNQTIYGSIGYATGASVGAFQAMKENAKYKRGILVTGEGSLHLTVQAFADLLRFELKPIIFVLNNSGYTIERLIHGPNADYNTVAEYDYSVLAQTFGPKFPSKYHGPICTAEELVSLLESGKLREDSFQLVEVILDKLDAPLSVRNTGAAVGRFNEK